MATTSIITELIINFSLIIFWFYWKEIQESGLMFLKKLAFVLKSNYGPLMVNYPTSTTEKGNP